MTTLSKNIRRLLNISGGVTPVTRPWSLTTPARCHRTVSETSNCSIKPLVVRKLGFYLLLATLLCACTFNRSRSLLGGFASLLRLLLRALAIDLRTTSSTLL